MLDKRLSMRVRILYVFRLTSTVSGWTATAPEIGGPTAMTDWARHRSERRPRPRRATAGGGHQGRLVTDGGAPTERGGGLFEALPDPTILLDVEGELRVVSVNEAFEETFGCTADSVVGEPVDELPMASDLSTDTLDALADADSVSREVSCETTHGQRRFLFRTVPTEGARVYGSYTDITERASYEADLTALHEMARQLMVAESVSEVLDISVAAARGVLGHEMNAIFLYEADRDALVPATATERTRELLGELPVFPNGDGIAWRALDTGQTVVCDDVRDDPDVFNETTPFRSELLFPLGEEGVLIAGSTEIGVFDSTDTSLGRVLADTIHSALRKVEREETLRDREAALTRKNERLDEFASVVSHDLRTPLDLAGVHLELAREDGATHERLEDVAAAHDRMSDLIEDVLTWAHEGDAIEATTVVSLPSLVSECWAERELETQTLEVTTDRTVQADRGRLRQVFDNLLDNAIAYGGESVTVTVGDLDDDGVFVADDGPGIPELEREAVFNSGHTLSMAGTGFGLAIVRQIVEAHGWSITLAESRDGGARFEIRFGDEDSGK